MRTHQHRDSQNITQLLVAKAAPYQIAGLDVAWNLVYIEGKGNEDKTKRMQNSELSDHCWMGMKYYK